jgi:hypothetical protein
MIFIISSSVLRILTIFLSDPNLHTISINEKHMSGTNYSKYGMPEHVFSQLCLFLKTPIFQHCIREKEDAVALWVGTVGKVAHQRQQSLDLRTLSA